MYSWIKSYDDSRPVHYEADIYAETMDMYSKMYPSVELIVDFGRDASKDKPLVLCEFVHAMGNGPGNIKEYVDAFYEYPKLQGGFVWEWANHGLLTKDKETGEEYYGYGGDFGDYPNDLNFVMDGVLHSDHTPTPGLIEYKKGLEPVKVVSHTPQAATIVSRYDFITLDHLDGHYTILDEGGLVAEGAINIPTGIQPGATASLTLPAPPSKLKGEGILQLSFRQRSATASLPAGHEIAFEEIPLTSAAIPLLPALQPPKATTTDDGKLSINETSTFLTITSATTSWTFSPVHGALNSLRKNGREFLATAPQFTAYRAPTDNDFPQDARDWKEARLDAARVSTRACTWGFRNNDGVFEVRVSQRFAPPVLSWSLDLEFTYTFTASGTLAVRVRGVPRGLNLPPTLPRIGLSFEALPDWAAGGVTWYGRGPGESYRDKKLSQRAGVHAATTIDELWVDYEFPQEGGNRTDTRWVRFGGDGDAGITAQFVDLASDKDGGGARTRKLFDFNASHYRVLDVEAANHPYELRRKKTENVVIRLDAAHHGLGTGSCGPKTRDEYALRCEEFEFEVVLQ